MGGGDGQRTFGFVAVFLRFALNAFNLQQYIVSGGQNRLACRGYVG